MRASFWLGLGANLGHPAGQLRRALVALSRRHGPLLVSPLFRSAAVSPLPQPEFLNCVVELRSAGDPSGLLREAKDLERAFGRTPESAGSGPRPLDVDLLLWEGGAYRAPGLELPHPRLATRSFVLAPLVALTPEAAVPGAGGTVAELWARLPKDPSLVRVPWARVGEEWRLESGD